MATINIANLTFTHKGDYDGSTAYVKNDVVYYSTNGNAYIAKQNTTGNVPTNGTYWSQFAAGSGGIWSGALSLGSANQVVAVNSSANALEFQDASGGKTLALQSYEQTSRVSLSSTSSETSLLSGSFTQIKANSKLLISYAFPFFTEQSGSSRTYFTFDGTKTFDAWNWDYRPASSNTFDWTGSFVVSGSSTTGSKNWVIGWHCASGNARPASVFCPSSADDSRLGQTKGRMIIQELDF